MANFKFDEKKSPEENISLFYTHLETIDKDLASLLKDNINILIPLPDGVNRTSVRQKFNKTISTAILKEKSQEEANAK
jgi:hypothetical protein